MPTAARHAAGLVLAERGYRSIGDGPVVWRSTRARRAAQGPSGGWSGYFVLEGAPDAIFDITEWIDRDHSQPVIRYAYQVRYCSGLRAGVGWQHRLDYHPLADPAILAPHYHDHPTREDEHDPRAWGNVLRLTEAMPLLEQHLFSRIGSCTGRAPGVRGRAPYVPSKGTVVIEP
ncbi:MAG: hypothetical protein ACYC9W_08570 [Candidatus Limnocylindria bacterium]